MREAILAGGTGGTASKIEGLSPIHSYTIHYTLYTTGILELRNNGTSADDVVQLYSGTLVDPKILQTAIKQNAHNHYKNSFYHQHNAPHHTRPMGQSTDEHFINGMPFDFQYDSSHLDVERSTFVFPLQVFVASDDLDVLQLANKRGFLADIDGVSQQTGNTGMLSTLLEHHELAYNASLEIIRDIFFLSQCTSLLGVAGSQVFRMAVAMSNATGALRYAAAEDYDQIGKVRGMSLKYKVVFAEDFDSP